MSARIVELRETIETARADLDALDPIELEEETADLVARLDRLPNLAQQLRNAPTAVKRQTFQAFGLQIEFDKAEKRLIISASVTEAVATAFENTKALRDGGLPVTVSDIAGAGFEPATFGL